MLRHRSSAPSPAPRFAVPDVPIPSVPISWPARAVPWGVREGEERQAGRQVGRRVRLSRRQELAPQ